MPWIWILSRVSSLFCHAGLRLSSPLICLSMSWILMNKLWSLQCFWRCLRYHCVVCGSSDYSQHAFATWLIGDVSPNTQASGMSIQRHLWSLAMASRLPRYPQGWPRSPGVTKMPSMGLDPLLCVGGRLGPCQYAIALDIPKLWKKLCMLGDWMSLLTSIAIRIWLPDSTQEAKSSLRSFQNWVWGCLFHASLPSNALQCC